MSMARSLPVKTWKSGRTASRSASRSHSSCRLSDECLAPMHCGISSSAAVRVEREDAAVGHEHRAELEADEPVERRADAPSSASTHPSSSSALSPCDGKITGVPPRAAIASAAAQVARRGRTGRPASSATNAPATKSPPVHAAGEVEHALRVVGRRGAARSRCPCSPPGVRPAATVRATCASTAAQSIAPSAVNGSSTADMPVMVRPGRSGRRSSHPVRSGLDVVRFRRCGHVVPSVDCKRLQVRPLC